MDIKGRTALVTGAGGFIGSHLVESLIQNKVKVKALVHYNSKNSWGNLEFLSKTCLNNINIIQGDVRDYVCVRKAVRGCDIVFHLAALIGIPYSYEAPVSYVSTNVNGTLNILQSCLEEGVKKVIHTSTSETYGTAQYSPIDEQHPLVGQSPYSASKIAADKLAESYFLSFRLPVATIRPFNTYGPRQSSRAVIPTIISQALSGDTIRLGSIETIRDFNYIKDTVSGFILAAMSNKSIGQVLNIGSGNAVSISKVIDLIKYIFNKDFTIIKDEQRIRPVNSEVWKLVCNYQKAKKIVKYTPNYTLIHGIKNTVKFIKNNLSSYKSGYTI